MKASDEIVTKINIKSATKLGKGESNKPPPLLIRFSHPSERNMMLPLSKNISDRNIKIEKHIPKNYQAQYKVFKELQFKLKNMPEMEYKTQIVFDGHLLQLRIKSGDSDWTIYESWTPPLASSAEMKTSLVSSRSNRATAIPSSQTKAKANSSFLMQIKGLADETTADTVRRELLKYINEDHKSLVKEVVATKKSNLFTVYCDSWKSAKSISLTDNGKFMDHDISFTLFSKEEPSTN